MRWVGIGLFFYWLFSFVYLYQNFSTYNWLWFCHISALFVAIALILKRKEMVLGNLYIALFAQGYYLLELGVQVIIGPIAALHTSYMFEPAIDWILLLVNIGHFVVPITILWYVRGYYSRLAKWYAIGVFLLLMLVSYMLSDADANLNCTYEFCTYGITFPGFLIAYLLVWALVIFALDFAWSKIWQKKVYNYILYGLIAIVILIFLGYMIHYLQTPHYSCYADGVGCAGVYTYQDEWYVDIYSDRSCELEIYKDGEFLDTFVIDPEERTRYSYNVPPITQNSVLEISCKDL